MSVNWVESSVHRLIPFNLDTIEICIVFTYFIKKKLYLDDLTSSQTCQVA